ncbi:MAG: DUF58 domain-containing protein [Pseudoxanthomonas sp.]
MRKRIDGWIEKLARPRQPEPLPVAIDRRRVYVVPTRFGLFFALLLGAMLLGALNYNNNPALLLALLLAAAGLASLVAAHLQLSGLRVDAISAEPVAAGNALRTHLALAVRDRRLRRGLSLQVDGQRARAPTFGDEAVVEFDLPTVRRGWLTLPRIRISTTQPLGLALAWSWIWPDTPLLVYPAPEPQPPPLPGGEGGSAHARLHPAGDEVHHLRPYRAGDARRAIAWKPSARRDALLVREYEQPVGAETVLDWFALSSLPWELRIRRLAAWIDLAEREGRRYRLRLPGQPALGPAHGPSHRHLCLRALALMPEG